MGSVTELLPPSIYHNIITKTIIIQMTEYTIAPHSIITRDIFNIFSIIGIMKQFDFQIFFQDMKKQVLDWLRFETPFQAMSLYTKTKPWSLLSTTRGFLFPWMGMSAQQRSQGEMSWRLRKKKMSTVTKSTYPPF